MLYFRGCTAREKQTGIEKATERLLEIADVDFHTLADEKQVLLMKPKSKSKEILKF